MSSGSPSLPTPLPGGDEGQPRPLPGRQEGQSRSRPGSETSNALSGSPDAGSDSLHPSILTTEATQHSALSTPYSGRGAMFRALRNRNYRLYWGAQLVSLSGSWLQRTAMTWLVLEITDSPLAVGLITMLQ